MRGYVESPEILLLRHWSPTKLWRQPPITHDVIPAVPSHCYITSAMIRLGWKTGFLKKFTSSGRIFWGELLQDDLSKKSFGDQNILKTLLSVRKIQIDYSKSTDFNVLGLTNHWFQNTHFLNRIKTLGDKNSLKDEGLTKHMPHFPVSSWNAQERWNRENGKFEKTEKYFH